MEMKNDGDYSISSIIKTIIVFFVSIMVYQGLPRGLLKDYKLYDYYAMYVVMIYIVSVFLLNNFVLFVSLTIEKKIKNTNLSHLAETAFLIVVISLPMCLLNTFESEYKLIFLLIIILTVIKSGLRYGVLTSILIDTIILTLDIFSADKINGINVQFERDLMICIIFIFVAWILGQYVTIESDNKIKKEKEVDQLKAQLDKRKNIELLLLKNEICYDMVFENSSNSIILHDNNKILYVNESAAKLLGFKEPSQLINKSIHTYYPKDKILAAQSKYSNIIDNKLSKIVEEEIVIDVAGKNVEVRNTSSFFVYNSKVCVLTFLLDLTSQKELEMLKVDAENNIKLLNETREFNNLITELFTNISHELKTPVNVIYTAIQTMNLYLENYNAENIDKCKNFLKIMKQNCFRMIRLVNNLLDITKVDSGFMKLNRTNDNIVRVVEDITQSVATYVKSKNLELVFDTNVEEKIMAFDHDKIERIILNLLSNAYKYSSTNGEIKVNLNAKREDVIITVKDDGIGIPKQKLDIIFQRFGQANRSLSREMEGTGLGLYLVKSFVEMHNGKISVKSGKGEGTEFTMVLPVEIIEDQTCIDKSFCGNSRVERINIEFSDVYSVSTDV